MSGDQLERMSQGHLQSLAHHPEKSQPRLCSPPKLHESFLSTHVVYLQRTRCIRNTPLQLFVAQDFALMLIHLIGEYSGGSFFEKAALLNPTIKTPITPPTPIAVGLNASLTINAIASSKKLKFNNKM